MPKLTRREVLVGAAMAAATPGLVRAADGSKRLMIITAAGGWDPSFVFVPRLGDPEVDGPEVDEDPDNPDDREAVRSFGEMPLVVNDFKRPSVSAFFERWSSKSLVVNGIWTGAIAHTPSLIRILTGTADATRPDFGVVAGAELGLGLPLGTVDLSGRAQAGELAASLAKVGHRGQILALVDPAGQGFDVPDLPGFTPSGYVPRTEDDAAIRAYLRARAERWTERRDDGLGHTTSRLADWALSWDRAERLEAEAAELLAALEVGVAPTPLEASLVGVDLLDRRLCSTVMVDTGFDWDTHAGNALQHGYYEALFYGLEQVVSELDARGMLEDTLVCVLSEMTRTPRLNEELGKGHWPHATALLIGGGISGGRVLGGYDPLLQSLAMNLSTGGIDPSGEMCTYDRFVAGILEHLGVDPQPWVGGASPLRAFV